MNSIPVIIVSEEERVKVAALVALQIHQHATADDRAAIALYGSHMLSNTPHSREVLLAFFKATRYLRPYQMAVAPLIHTHAQLEHFENAVAMAVYHLEVQHVDAR